MKKLSIIGLVALAIGAGACGGNSEHEAAVALDARVDSAIQAGDYAMALDLIDTLNVRYPLELDLRKASMTKRAGVMEKTAMKRIPELESEMAATDSALAVMQVEFVERQPSKSLPPFLVYKEISAGNFADQTGIQPRVNTGDDASDTPWTLAVNAGRDIQLARITVHTEKGAAYDIDTPVSDGWMASVTPERVEALAAYLADNPGDRAVRVDMTGSKGKATAKVSPATSHAIVASREFARLRSQKREQLIEREKLERSLQIARDQAANAPRPAPEK